ncbi:DNA-binding storekeeper protein-relatedtranscriptional regulator [Striga asiatica]|uniref:DNA-binding storekeeper protein-relatedtranscriptional regulator n=1 Tax=Striga asiatica TaxID=4170 RepID=A0A5A7QWK1_STRAF|nr:DNA-binding storekeeper protein-relatedtranscriptional regulator [Striga asiatica]
MAKTGDKPKLKKQRNPRHHSESESEERDHSESEPESEEKPKQPIKQQPNPVAESESDSESESEEKMKSKKPNPSESEEKSEKKRKPLPAGEAESSKKKKKIEQKSAFQRKWSHEDEIALLKGLLEFQKDGKKCEDMDAFHEFIKNKLQMTVTKTQLQSKIRTLKNKYNNNNKGKEIKFKEDGGGGKESYDLSKLVWGSELKPMSRESMNIVLVDDKEWKKLLVDETEAYITYQNAKVARANHLLSLIKSST